MKVVFALLCTAVFFAAAAAQDVAVAKAKLTPTADYGAALNITGFVTFTLNGDSTVTVAVNVSGTLGTADYAIHVHQYGDITNSSTGKSAGSHFVGAGSATHGCPPSLTRHEGDMGNWTATGDVIVQSKTLDLLDLTGPANSIVGLAVVMHEHADNCTGPTGYAGNFLATGVIGIVNVTNNTAANGNTTYTSAVAALLPTSNGNSSMNGTVWFTETADGVRVVAQVSGLSLDSLHGFHIHAFGDLTKADGTSVGSHYNPTDHLHGLPDATRHVGDLGNLQSYDPTTGVAYYDDTTTNIPDVHSLLGRAVAVHSGRDHGSGYGCDQAGTSGTRILLGVIGVPSPSNTPITVPITVNNVYSNLDCKGSGSTLSGPLLSILRLLFSL